MTSSLKHAVEKLNSISEKEQDAIAILLEEELKWNASFSQSQNTLEHLAQEAIEEYKKGKTQPLNLK